MAYNVWGSTTYGAGMKVKLKLKLYPPTAATGGGGGGGGARPTEGKMFPRGKP
jgi:hypothetical protein